MGRHIQISVSKIWAPSLKLFPYFIESLSFNREKITSLKYACKNVQKYELEDTSKCKNFSRMFYTLITEFWKIALILNWLFPLNEWKARNANWNWVDFSMKGTSSILNTILFMKFSIELLNYYYFKYLTISKIVTIAIYILVQKFIESKIISDSFSRDFPEN